MNASTLSFLTLLTCALFVHTHVRVNGTDLIFYIMRDPVWTDNNIGGHEIAAMAINDRTDILADHKIVIRELIPESQADAISKALSTISSVHNADQINHTQSVVIPIMLGPPFSSYASILSPALKAFSWGMMSAGATATALSTADSFSTFHRTIPADSLSVLAVIELCVYFGWDQIAVIYTSDTWGIYFANGLSALGAQNGIETNLITFGRDLLHVDRDKYEYTVDVLKKWNLFVVVLIAHTDEIGNIFQALDQEGMARYPYYYIYVEIGKADVELAGVQPFCEGIIGVNPWVFAPPPEIGHGFSAQDAFQQNSMSDIYDASAAAYAQFTALWTESNADQVPSLHEQFKWDSMHTMADVLQRFDAEYNLSKLLAMNESFVLSEIQKIIHTHVFNGLTGKIAFDGNGDRKHGLIAFSNVVDSNATIQYFGVLSDDFIVIEPDLIVWPKEFRDVNVIPHSHVIVSEKELGIDAGVAWVMTGVSLVSMIPAFLYFYLLWRHRELQAIKAISWKLNQISCVGCIIAFANIIVYWQAHNDVLCNIRGWLFVVTYTLVLMPLWLKTYRVSVIFTGLAMDDVDIPDFKLMLVIGACVAVDVCLLAIFAIIDPYTVRFEYGAMQQVDALRTHQLVYQVCKREHDVTQTVAHVVILSWKSLQFLFGVYVIFIVSRIGHYQINRFRETKSQLISMLFTVFAFCVAQLIIASQADFVSPSKHGMTGIYAVYSVVAILICHVVMHSNMFKRFRVIYSSNKDLEEFDKSDRELMEQFMVTRLKRISSMNTLFKTYSKACVVSPDIDTRNNGNKTLHVIPDLSPTPAQIEIQQMQLQ